MVAVGRAKGWLWFCLTMPSTGKKGTSKRMKNTDTQFRTETMAVFI